MITIKGQPYDYLFTVICENEADFMYKQKLLIEKGWVTEPKGSNPFTYKVAGSCYRPELNQDIDKPIFLNVWSDKVLTYEINLYELLRQICIDEQDITNDDLTIIDNHDEFLVEINSFLEGKKMDLL